MFYNSKLFKNHFYYLHRGLGNTKQQEYLLRKCHLSIFHFLCNNRHTDKINYKSISHMIIELKNQTGGTSLCKYVLFRHLCFVWFIKYNL